MVDQGQRIELPGRVAAGCPLNQHVIGVQTVVGTDRPKQLDQVRDRSRRILRRPRISVDAYPRGFKPLYSELLARHPSRLPGMCARRKRRSQRRDRSYRHTCHRGNTPPMVTDSGPSRTLHSPDDDRRSSDGQWWSYERLIAAVDLTDCAGTVLRSCAGSATVIARPPAGGAVPSSRVEAFKT